MENKSDEVHVTVEDDTTISESNSKETLKELGDVLSKIEKSKQHTAVEQIKATDRDNERQYSFALKNSDYEHSKWKTTFAVAAIGAAVLSAVGIILIFTGQQDLGLGLLATTLSGIFGYIAGAGSCKK